MLIQSSAGANNTNRLIVAEVEALISIQDRANVIEGYHRIVSLFRQLGVST